MTSSLPLLHVPYLAVKEIIKSMQIREVFLLSLTSERVRRAIRAAFLQGSIKIFIADENRIEVSPSSLLHYLRDLPPMMTMHGCHIVDRDFQFYPLQNQLLLIKTDELLEFYIPDLIMLLSHLSKIFNEPVTTWKFKTISEDSAVSKFSSAIDAGIRINKLKVEIEKISSRAYQYFLNSSVSDLTLNSKLDSPLELFELRTLNFNFLRLHDVSWAQPEQFLSCETVYLREHNLSAPWLNQFFKKFIASESCRLKFISIPWNLNDFEKAVEGLSENKNIEKTSFGRKLEIERCDGSKVKIVQYAKVLDLHSIQF